MKRKLAALILSASMIASSINIGYTYADNVSVKDTKDNIVSVNIEDATDNKQNTSPVLTDLVEQVEKSGKKYKDTDKVKVIVEVNDDTMEKKHSLASPDISKVRTEKGLEKQIEYAKKSQDILKEELDKKGIDYKVTQTYDTVLNGISVETTLEDAKKIANIAEVNSMELNRTIKAPVVTTGMFKPLDTASNTMINANEKVMSKYSGDGKLIAIIDSGADPNHEVFKNWKATSKSRIKNAQDIASIVAEKNIDGAGVYFNDKIVYGYNYADRNANIKENKTQSHGMHVAGIVAANGEKLKGVAPNAQLAIMRVFSDSAFMGGTNPEIYNKAIDDAVKMGVDSINMSLGSTSVTDNRVEDSTNNALANAQKAGIVVSVAVGNDGFMGFQAKDLPYAKNPDIGLVNSPAVADISLAVASVDNTRIKQKGISVKENGKEVKKIVFRAGETKNSSTKFSNYDYPFVHVFEGYKEDYDNIGRLDGKIALIKRGDKEGRHDEITFSKKVKTAQDHGAIAAIIYNNEDDKTLVSMAGFDEEGVSIPTAFITKSDGEFLIEHKNATLEVETRETEVDNPTAWQVSNFSSWGLSQEGNMKPDISAPGGSINSSFNNNEYGYMSGTSMAAPHVAGGIAVVKEYVEQEFPKVIGVEKHRLIKNLLMSSARPYRNASTNALTSPRSQGAGLMQLDNATTSKVVIEGTNDISSINLGNIKSNDVVIKGKLHNYGNTEKTFNYVAELNTDSVADGKILLKPKNIKKSDTKTIVVSPNSTKEFEVKFTLSEQEVSDLKKEMENGFFLEGYVLFEIQGGLSQENISVPFVGFKGDWSDINVIEESIYDLLAKNQQPYYYERANVVPNPFTHLSTKVVGEDVPLGEIEDSTYENPKYDKDKIAFSPNNDGRADEISFVGTFLRNYKDLKIKVYNDKDKDIDTPIYTVEKNGVFGVKNYFVGGFGGPNLTTTKPEWKWSGVDSANLPMPEGKYVFEVSVKADGKNIDKEQKIKFPVTIDTTFPRIVKSSYDESTGVFELSKVEENGSGIKSQIIKIGEIEYKADKDGRFALPPGTKASLATLEVKDYAQNTQVLKLEDAIRRGDEKTIVVSPRISVGAVPMDKFKWVVLDKDGNSVNPYDLKVGSYILQLISAQEPFEFASEPRIPFEITESDTTKVIPVNFIYKNKKEVTVAISKPRSMSVDVVLVNAETGEEYPMSVKSSTQYVTNVPQGNYKVYIKNVPQGYVATIDPDQIVVGERGVTSANSEIIVSKIENKDVKVKIERNGYEDELTVVLRGTDVKRDTRQIKFEKGESEKTISLPIKQYYDVYVKDLKDSSYGLRPQEKEGREIPVRFKVSMSALGYMNDLNINLEKGVNNLAQIVEKNDLFILINKADYYKENGYTVDSWEVFEKVVAEAITVWRNKNATQDEVDNVRAKLEEAFTKLVSRGTGNKQKLKDKIDEAQAIYDKIDSEKYDQKSIEFLLAAIEGARIAYKSDDPYYNTADYINSSINMLDRAIANLKLVNGGVDKSALVGLIAQAENLIREKDLYTDDSIGNLQTVLEIAKEINDNKDARHDEVKEQVSLLRNYINLVQSKVDKSALKMKIQEADKITDLSKYDLDARSPFRKAREQAKEVMANRKATKQEVDEAYNKLVETMKILTGNTDVSDVIDKSTSIENPKTKSMVDLSHYIKTVAKVSKVGDKYSYTVRFNKVEFELNGKTINSNITKLNVNGQNISATKVGDISEFTFTLDRQISSQDVKVSIDILEELNVKPLDAKLNFK